MAQWDRIGTVAVGAEERVAPPQLLTKTKTTASSMAFAANTQSCRDFCEKNFKNTTLLYSTTKKWRRDSAKRAKIVGVFIRRAQHRQHRSRLSPHGRAAAPFQHCIIIIKNRMRTEKRKMNKGRKKD